MYYMYYMYVFALWKRSVQSQIWRFGNNRNQTENWLTRDILSN